MDKNLTSLLNAVEKFTAAKNDEDLLTVFSLLPEERRDYHARFDAMFINADNHLFFMLTTNLAEWIDEIEDNDTDYNSETYEMLGELWDLFEFVSDGVTPKEQTKVIEQAKEILAKFHQH